MDRHFLPAARSSTVGQLGGSMGGEGRGFEPGLETEAPAAAAVCGPPVPGEGPGFKTHWPLSLAARALLTARTASQLFLRFPIG